MGVEMGYHEASRGRGHGVQCAVPWVWRWGAVSSHIGVEMGCSEASRGRRGGARRLLQVCSQFDQQTAAAAAANAGLVVVGDGLVPAAGSGC